MAGHSSCQWRENLRRVDCGAGDVGAGWELPGEGGGGAGNEGAGWVEEVRAGAESEEEEEEAEDKEETEEPVSRPGSNKVGISDPDGVGISDRDVFRPAITC